jgi:hypothetical protein
MPPSTFLSPAQRFAGIVNGLFHAIAMRRDAGFLAGPAALLLWTRLGHLRERITRLAARLASGKGSGVPRGKHARLEQRAAAPQPPGRPSRRLAGQAGWLIRLVPEAAAAGSQLQHLLADPEMAALAAAAPQLGRLLRPLCRSLSVAPPAYLAPPPRPPRPQAHRSLTARTDTARTGAARINTAWPGLRRPYRLHGLPLHGPPHATAPPVRSSEQA